MGRSSLPWKLMSKLGSLLFLRAGDILNRLNWWYNSLLEMSEHHLFKYICIVGHPLHAPLASTRRIRSTYQKLYTCRIPGREPKLKNAATRRACRPCMVVDFRMRSFIPHLGMNAFTGSSCLGHIQRLWHPKNWHVIARCLLRLPNRGRQDLGHARIVDCERS